MVSQQANIFSSIYFFLIKYTISISNRKRALVPYTVMLIFREWCGGSGAGTSLGRIPMMFHRLMWKSYSWHSRYSFLLRFSISACHFDTAFLNSADFSEPQMQNGPPKFNHILYTHAEIIFCNTQDYNLINWILIARFDISNKFPLHIMKLCPC